MIGGCFALAWMGQFAHLLRDTCDWRIIALARGSLAFVFALGLARASGAQLVLWKPPALWLRGCASSFSLLATFYALTRLPTSEVLTLTNTFPIWVALLSWPLLQVRPSLSVGVAAGASVVGVALIQAPHPGAAAGAAGALALAVTAAFTNAIAMLGLHRLKGVHPWAIVVHYSGVAVVFVIGATLMGEMPDWSPLRDGRTIVILLGVGVAATLGQVCVTKAFTSGDPARVSVVGLTQILFALGLDLCFHPTSISPQALLGIGLILVPTAWVMRQPKPALARVAASPLR